MKNGTVYNYIGDSCQELKPKANAFLSYFVVIISIITNARAVIRMNHVSLRLTPAPYINNPKSKTPHCKPQSTSIHQKHTYISRGKVDINFPFRRCDLAYYISASLNHIVFIHALRTPKATLPQFLFPNTHVSSGKGDMRPPSSSL